MNYNNKIKFTDNYRKALGHSGSNQKYLPQRENIEPHIFPQNYYQNEDRRGDYIPSYQKLASMPVRFNQVNQNGE